MTEAHDHLLGAEEAAALAERLEATTGGVRQTAAAFRSLGDAFRSFDRHLLEFNRWARSLLRTHRSGHRHRGTAGWSRRYHTK